MPFTIFRNVCPQKNSLFAKKFFEAVFTPSVPPEFFRAERMRRARYFFAIFAHESRNVDVRLKTGAPSFESTGSGKK